MAETTRAAAVVAIRAIFMVVEGVSSVARIRPPAWMRPK
jgi:hypothetical protein